MASFKASVPLRLGENGASKAREGSVLPVLLPPSTLRPLAFRTLSKKHNLAFTSVTLQTVSTFIGKHCGSGWREEGLAELALDEVAKIWKKSGGGSIVEDGSKPSLKFILNELETRMAGGRIHPTRKLPSPTPVVGDSSKAPSTQPSPVSGKSETQALDTKSKLSRPRKRLKVIDAFDQPRLTYNTIKKDFERPTSSPSLFPTPRNRITLFRDRYYRVHQRLLRNDAFQSPVTYSSETNTSRSYRLTSITSLQGRGNANHLILGLLSSAPEGGYCLSDSTGTVNIDLEHTKAIPQNGAWFSPGMILLADGVYEDDDSEDANMAGSTSTGAIGGRFVVLTIAGPPCERREASLAIEKQTSGWNLKEAVRSEKTLLNSESGSTAPGLIDKAEAQCVVIIGELSLDNPKATEGFRNLLELYDTPSDSPLPSVFLLTGNFVHDVAVGAGNSGSIEYKEFFDTLASILTDFPNLLRNSTFVFVPGDNDPWASSFVPGATGCVPRSCIPDLFTSRIRRAFQTARSQNNAAQPRLSGEGAIWTSNPTRIAVDGSASEMIVYRDDISGRLRRNSLVFKTDKEQSQSENNADGHNIDVDLEAEEAPSSLSTISTKLSPKADEKSLAIQRLVKSILDQGFLCPFPPTIRPVLWDYASALHLYPLPNSLVLVDPEAEPFAVTYEGCHAMNPGRFIVEGSNDMARWIEYNVSTNKGHLRQEYL